MNKRIIKFAAATLATAGLVVGLSGVGGSAEAGRDSGWRVVQIDSSDSGW